MAKTFPPEATPPLILGTAAGWRWLIYLLVLPLGLFLLASPLLFYQGQFDGAFLGLTALVALLGLLLVAAAYEVHKARFTFTEQRIEYAGGFRRKELFIKDLRGFRADGRYIRIFAHGKRLPALTLGYTTEGYTTIQRWLAARIPDLDAAEQQVEEKQLLQDDNYGFSEEQRAQRLAQARRVCQVLNGVGAAVGLWLFFLPRPYEWAVAAALPVPLLAAGVLHWSRGLVRLDEAKNSAHPGVILAVLLPAMALALRALLDVEVLHYAPVWRAAGPVAAFFALLLASSRGAWKPGTGRWLSALLLLFVAVPYGYGAVQLLNSAFDQAPAQAYPAPVLSKRSSSGKTTTYYLKLGPWGPRAEPEDVTVDRELYEQTAVGAQVQVYQKPGRLGIPWFFVGP